MDLAVSIIEKALTVESAPSCVSQNRKIFLDTQDGFHSYLVCYLGCTCRPEDNSAYRVCSHSDRPMSESADFRLVVSVDLTTTKRFQSQLFIFETAVIDLFG